jgi:hypothetical protein
VITRFKSGEFKLSGNTFIYSHLKTRRELVDLIYVLLFLSGSSMEEARSLTNTLSVKGEAAKKIDFKSIAGHGLDCSD